MDNVAIALGLIKAYKEQFNLEAKNKRKIQSILKNFLYVDKMTAQGLNVLVKSDLSYYAYTRSLRFFYDKRGIETRCVYVSKGVKNADIRRLNKEIKRLESNILPNEKPAYYLSNRLVNLKAEIQGVKDTPVEAELGKMWRSYIKAVYNSEQAYKKKFEVRTAIKVFNKLNTGVSIHFGNSRVGSMNRIDSVSLDGDRLPIKKFLENAEFENAILAAVD